jgi:hypothetical protein
MDAVDLKATHAVGATGQGTEIRAARLPLARYRVGFEFCSLSTPFRTSYVPDRFKIVLNDRTVCSGRPVLRSLLDAEPACLCEAVLDEGRIDIELWPSKAMNDELNERFAPGQNGISSGCRRHRGFSDTCAFGSSNTFALAPWLAGQKVTPSPLSE